MKYLSASVVERWISQLRTIAREKEQNTYLPNNTFCALRQVGTSSFIIYLSSKDQAFLFVGLKNCGASDNIKSSYIKRLPQLSQHFLHCKIYCEVFRRILFYFLVSLVSVLISCWVLFFSNGKAKKVPETVTRSGNSSLLNEMEIITQIWMVLSRKYDCPTPLIFDVTSTQKHSVLKHRSSSATTNARAVFSWFTIWFDLYLTCPMRK